MAYHNLAQIYDLIMSYVPYQNWVMMIDDISSRYFDHSPKLFEIGGGTGTLGSILKYQGYDYLGSDLIPEMAQVAWDKGLDYIVADCRNLPVNNKYDMALFLFDGINYLSNLDDYAQTFKEVWKTLSKDGLFFFDVTTEYNSLTNFSDYYEADSFDNGAYIRNSFYDVELKEQYNIFDIFVEDNENLGLYNRYKEKHTQHLFQ